MEYNLWLLITLTLHYSHGIEAQMSPIGLTAIGWEESFVLTNQSPTVDMK